MTVTDFVLMAALVISTTFGLVRAGGAKHPIERGICLFGAVCVSDFGSSDAKLRTYRYEANSWLGSQYNAWVSDHLYGEFPGHQ